MKKKIKVPLYVVLGTLSLIAGIVFSWYMRDGIAGIPGAKNLLSQSVPEEPKNTVSSEVEPVDTDKITNRIKQLEAEIVQETNDPERDFRLRSELQSLRDQLK